MNCIWRVLPELPSFPHQVRSSRTYPSRVSSRVPKQSLFSVKSWTTSFVLLHSIIYSPKTVDITLLNILLWSYLTDYVWVWVMFLLCCMQVGGELRQWGGYILPWKHYKGLVLHTLAQMHAISFDSRIWKINEKSEYGSASLLMITPILELF